VTSPASTATESNKAQPGARLPHEWHRGMLWPVASALTARIGVDVCRRPNVG
jgi:hypothetical protein